MNFSELLVVLIVFMIVFSPKKLPELAETLGRFIKQAKYYREAIKNEVNTVIQPMLLQAKLKENEARAEEVDKIQK